MINEKSYDNCLPALRKIEKNLREDTYTRFVGLPKKDWSCAFNMLLKYHDVNDIVKWMDNHFGSQNSEFAKNISDVVFQKDSSKKIRTVGIFYHRFFDGGVEKVISLHVPMFLKLGYEVVLFTEKRDKRKEYSFPDNVKIVTIPEKIEEDRSEIFRNALLDNKIDLFIHHSASSVNLIYDIITVKATGIKLFILRHEITTAQMLYKSTHMESYPYAYKMCDCLINLSRTEEWFYKQFGINAVYINNPVSHLKRNSVSNNFSKKNICWIGRLDRLKGYMDALEIMKKVISVEDDVKFYMVGGEYTQGASKAIKKYISINKLNKHIVMIDYNPNIDKFYENTTIYLSTSLSESFSMTICEAKSFGIPLVAYRLPNIEILRDGKGCIEVEQHDISGASDAIIRILHSEELYSRLSLEARQSYDKFNEIDIQSKWDALIANSECETKHESDESKEYSHIFWELLMHCYKECINNKEVQTVSVSNVSDYDMKKIQRYNALVAFLDRLVPKTAFLRSCIKKPFKILYRLIK